jgi:regulator of sigma E protease
MAKIEANLVIILAAVISLGIMILVHEWGHFIVARLCGVRVDVFSIGFGPRLWGWKRGTTDYRLSLLPFGGWVKMAGDNPVEERSGASDEFLSKTRWQRVLIAIAGPVMNILLTMFLLFVLFKVGITEPAFLTAPAQVAAVLPETPAAQAGIQVGDEIKTINSARISNWEDVLTQLQALTPGKPLSLEVERSGQTVPVTEPVPTAHPPIEEFALVGYPNAPAIVGSVNPGSPADKAGLKADDEIISANGQPVISFSAFTWQIRHSDGKPFELQVRRDGKMIPMTIQPAYGDPGDAGGTRWHIGFQPTSTTVRRAYPVVVAAKRSVIATGALSSEIFGVLAGLFQGRISLKQLEGPVGIMREEGKAARRGPMDFLQLMAIISINLGILNLLPIPILDGGHILMLAVESVIRRDLSLAVKERFVQVGLVFLLTVIAFVTYFDVVRMLPSH